MDPGRASWPRKVFGGAPGGFPPALAGAGLCRGSEAWELGARGRRELGQEPSRGCLEPPALLGAALQGRIWQGSQRKASRLGARTLHTPFSAAANRLGWGGVETFARRPLPTGPGSGSWQEKAVLPGASGLLAALGHLGRVGAFGSPDSAGKPAWLVPLYLPSAVLGYPRPIPDAQGTQGSRKRPQCSAMRVALSPAGLIPSGGRPRAAPGGPCAWSKLWGPPALSTTGPRLLRNGYHKWGHQCTPNPPSSQTSRACLSLTVLRSSHGGGGGSAPGAGSRRRGQPGLRRPPSGLARLQITPWLAAGVPAPARHRPLQLVAKFMPAALQWRPQSARSIPTARLRAVRPEGGVSGV